MLEFTLADQVADLPPGLTSSGQEWQFQVSYKQINWQIYPLLDLVGHSYVLRKHLCDDHT